VILRPIDRRSGIAGQADDSWAAGRGILGNLEQTLAQLGRDDWFVNLVLIDDRAMAELNRQYRSESTVTDVLSFTYLAATGDGPPALPAGQSGSRCDLWLDEAVHGDEDGPTVGEIVLAPDFVAGTCRQAGWDLANELALLVVHGCLHILGWEHREAADRERMQLAEEKWLDAGGFAHPLRGGRS
jgi:rRNA maturation RNase YbeY